MRIERASSIGTENDVNLNSRCRNLVNAAPEERKSLAQARKPWVNVDLAMQSAVGATQDSYGVLEQSVKDG